MPPLMNLKHNLSPNIKLSAIILLFFFSLNACVIKVLKMLCFRSRQTHSSDRKFQGELYRNSIQILRGRAEEPRHTRIPGV